MIRPRVPAETEPSQDGELERVYARRVVDLAMRTAETMLTVGASVNDVTLAALQVTKAYGVTPVHVDVTYTSITVSLNRGTGEDPLTVTRVVQGRTTDFTRLQRLDELVARVQAGLEIGEARTEFARITRSPHPYRRALITLANGGIAAGVAILLGGSAIITAVALITAVIITVLQHELGRRLLPAFFTQALGALIVTGTAMLMTWLAREHDTLGGVRPSIIVAAGIVVMLAGMSFVGAAQDAIDGYYVTAGARGFEVISLTLGIVVGITAGLQLGKRVGYELLLSSSAPGFGALHQQLIGAALVAVSYAVSTYSSVRVIGLSALMGLLGWGCYLLGGMLALGPAASSGLGALVGSFIAVLVSRRLKVPALALTTAAIVPLVPGTAVFRGLLQLVTANGGTAQLMNGTSTLLGAAGIAMALAAGISLGAFLGRPTRDTIITAARRMRRDSAT